MRFLLVDRIAELEAGRRVAGWKNVAMSEDYLEWHFPERPIVPGTLVLESCAQLAGWLEAASSDGASWFLLDGVRSARYYAFAVPGDRIELEVTCVEREGERRAYRAESHVGGVRGCQLEFEGRVLALDTVGEREAARRALAQLRGEAS